MNARKLLNGMIAAGLVLTAAAVARAGYPFAAVPVGTPPPVHLELDTKALPTKPGCSIVKANLNIGGKTVPFDFALYLPPGYPNLVGLNGGIVPVIVSLHNRGQIGGWDGGVLGESLPALLATEDWDGRMAGERPEHPVRLRNVAPMICIVPHCPSGYAWESPGMAQAVGQLIDAVVPAVHADPDRVCLTGFSYGASSTWVIAQQIPDRFAAIAPCDGRRTNDPKWTAERLKHVAIYLSAGDEDGDFTNDARAMLAGFAAADHPNFIYREWHDGNHYSYCSTYSDPIFWTWLQNQKRAPLSERPPTTPLPPPPAPAIAVKPAPPPAPKTPYLVLDEKSWPSAPGYSHLRGTARIGDQSRPFSVAIFLPRDFAAHPQHLPIVITLQNHHQPGNDGPRVFPMLAMLLGNSPSKNAALNARPGAPAKPIAPAAKPASERQSPGKPTPEAVPDNKPDGGWLPADARFIGLLPRLPDGVDLHSRVESELLDSLMEQTIRHYQADGSRVSLMGIGEAGSTVWPIAEASPRRFAAIAVLDANAPADAPAVVRTLQHTGIYLAVSRDDHAKLEQAQRLHAALISLPHRDFMWNVLPGNERAGAQELCGAPTFWGWLLAQRR